MKLKRLFIFLIVIVCLGVLSVYYPYLTGETAFEEETYKKEPANVIRVIDGDTIDTDIGEIRLLGINTPEKNMEYYEEAKEFLSSIENKSIMMLRDFEDTDRYDRKLRYVFYEDRLLNIEILEHGLGTSYLTRNLQYEDKLKKAEEFAINNGKKLWKKSDNKCAKCIELIELNPEKEYFTIKNKCDFECNLEKWTVKDEANHFFKLNNLPPGEQETYTSKTNIWNNDGDRLFMRDEKGLVLFYEY